MASRVSATRIIGRAAELATLDAALGDAAAGRPSLVFVAGESGVGKSRLLGELCVRARDAGARTLSGDCVELGEGELPYAPLVTALRPLAREEDRALTSLHPSARTELATLLPGLGPPPGQRPEEEAGASQRRLFEALLALLDALGRDTPLVLVLEDIHWADRSTRAFIVFLARSLLGERVVVVLTYRSDELHRRHPLRPLLAELEHDPRARRLELARLGRDELAELLGDVLGGPPDPELVERMYARSDGNPLFAEELLAAGLDGRGALPPTLRDALMVRVERLPESAQEVIRVVAVARRASHALLTQASGLGARELREALRAATAGHILTTDREDAYGFRHALLREVVVDDLLPGERAELHLELAHALEADDASAASVWATSAITHHYRAAGDQPAALRAGVSAAAAARRVRAYGESASLLEHVLEVWDRVPDAEALAGVPHAEVLMHAAASFRDAGDDPRRAEYARLAAEELAGPAGGEPRAPAPAFDPLPTSGGGAAARPAGPAVPGSAPDPEALAAALGELAGAQWSLGRGEESRATLERAIALVADAPPGPGLAALRSRQVGFLMLQGRYEPAVQAAIETLGITEPGGTNVDLLNRLGVSLFALGREGEGREAFDRALVIARETGHPVDAAYAVANLADALHRAGHSGEGLEVIRDAQALAQPGTRVGDWLHLTEGEILIDTGELERAEARLPRPGRLTGSARVGADLRWCELLLARGLDAEALPLLEDAEERTCDSLEPQYIAAVGVLRAELERRRGALDAARRAVDEAIDRIEYCSEDGERLAAVAAEGVAVEADAAERARDLGDSAAERTARDLAALHLARVEAATVAVRRVAAARRLMAVADGARAEGTPDPDAWAVAAEAWSALDRPYLAAAAQIGQAQAYAGQGERERATGPARAAAGIARELGAGWLAAEVEGLAARARLRLDPAAAAVTAETEAAPAAAREDAFGLTPRERQVLALLARGATNREIGAELYMAEKTASVHVSRILAKLDVRSRTEAAAVAHRQGLEQWPEAVSAR